MPNVFSCMTGLLKWLYYYDTLHWVLETCFCSKTLFIYHPSTRKVGMLCKSLSKTKYDNVQKHHRNNKCNVFVIVFFINTCLFWIWLKSGKERQQAVRVLEWSKNTCLDHCTGKEAPWWQVIVSRCGMKGVSSNASVVHKRGWGEVQNFMKLMIV